MPFDLVAHAKSRARSVQLEKCGAQSNADANGAANSTAHTAIAGSSSTAPTPSIRSSSLPAGQENMGPGSIRHFRSMLDVEEQHGKQIDSWKPISHEELASPRGKPQSPNGHANGYANGHANGHATNGHTVNGHTASGHALNGHAANGNATNGHAVNGHATNGHALNGHAPNGFTNGDAHHKVEVVYMKQPASPSPERAVVFSGDAEPRMATDEDSMLEMDETKDTEENTSNGAPAGPSARASPAPPQNGKLNAFNTDDDSASDTPAPAPSASDLRNIVRRKLTGYVGFANLPNQWHRKSVRKGFNFNVMVVGESGLGKSTLVNTLFNTSLYPPKERKGPSLDIIPKTVTIQSISADIEEAGVRLRLTVVDTPGFGDFVNNDESWRPITDNIEQRYDAYLDAENKVNRMNIVDNRIHACVFFIQPTGHALKPLDIEVMRRLHTKVNLIPVIAKADTLTDEEITNFKARILTDIKYHGIQIFEGPRYELDDAETIAENNEIMSKVPFAVVGATNEITNADGRKVRGRRYPWGVIEVDNEEHCDFGVLRQMLIRTHMEELKEHTNNILYENYRTDKLLAMGVSQDPSVFKEVNPAVKQEEERALHEQKLAKMEAEMKMVFQQKVAEKESKLKQSEEELYARHREMKEQLDKQRGDLEDRKQRVESGRPFDEKKPRKGFSLR